MQRPPESAPDPRLVAALVDRVTFHAHIIETGTESYRLKVTRASRPRNKTPPPGGAKSSEHDGANPG